MQPKKSVTTKHRMFLSTNLRHPRKFSQPLVVMVETFRMSAPFPVIRVIIHKGAVFNGVTGCDRGGNGNQQHNEYI